MIRKTGIYLILCLIIGMGVGVNIGFRFSNKAEYDEQLLLIQQERQHYDSLLAQSKQRQDSLVKKSDSLTQAGTIIVEKIRKIPVYVQVSYDTLGSLKLKELMIKEYDKRMD